MERPHVNVFTSPHVHVFRVHMKVITVISQKGGAGKTTLAIHLAAAGAGAGLAVLILDTDPQATASHWSEWRGSRRTLRWSIAPPLPFCPASSTSGRTRGRLGGDRHRPMPTSWRGRPARSQTWCWSVSSASLRPQSRRDDGRACAGERQARVRAVHGRPSARRQPTGMPAS
jgi:hypothetical protein